MNPHDHPCDVGTIDYKKAKDGYLICTVCGRTWTLGEKGWKVNPLTRSRPGSSRPTSTIRNSKFKPQRRRK